VLIEVLSIGGVHATGGDTALEHVVPGTRLGEGEQRPERGRAGEKGGYWIAMKIRVTGAMDIDLIHID
jgi:hypothetical protein